MYERVATENHFLKDNEIDVEATKKYINSAIKDAKWNKIFEKNFELCYSEVNQKLSEIEAKVEKLPPNAGGVKKDKCNIKLMATYACIQLETFFKVKN